MSPSETRRFRQSLPGVLSRVPGFASLFGVHPGTVYRWESDTDAAPTPPYVDAFASLLGDFLHAYNPAAHSSLHRAHVSAIRAASDATGAGPTDPSPHVQA